MQKKAPAIRFKDFTDAWEQRKLLDNVKKVVDFRGRTPKKLGLEWSIDGYLALSALNVKNGYIDETIDAHYGDQQLYDVWMTGNELHKGQVLFTTEAPMGNVAQVPDNKGYILSQRTIAFEVDEKVIAEIYLATVLSSPNIFNRLTELSSGGTAKGVSQKTLSELDIPIPNKVEEQKQIGKYFCNLDNLITLHQRKLSKLKTIKKALLEKMFPKNGSNVPEIRFAGFTDAWEQRKAKVIFKTLAEKGYPELPVLSASQEFGMIKRTETGINIHHDTRNEIGYKRVLPGQFVIHLRSFQGGFAHSAVEGITSPAYTVLDFQEQEIHYDYFWKYIFNSEAFIRRLELITYGIRDGRSISFEDFSTLDFYYPSCEEQKRIGMYFQEMDNLITLHQRKLEKLQNVKKACLEKMFV